MNEPTIEQRLLNQLVAQRNQALDTLAQIAAQLEIAIAQRDALQLQLNQLQTTNKEPAP